MAIRAEPSFSLKDELFNRTSVTELATGVARAHSAFPAQRFINDSVTGFPERELKARIQWLVECLHRHLPADVNEATTILLSALPPPLDPTLMDDDFGRFIWGVPAEYIAQYGCNKAHLTQSLEFLRESTQRFSAENPIRAFLLNFPKQTMQFVHRCAKDQNYHVRRLASEGIRPLLPWSPRVNIAHADIIEVLGLLHADKTRYVTRSIANTLNDITKSAPELVLATLDDWQVAGRQSADELQWMTRHALRTLLRDYDARALQLLGYNPKAKVNWHPTHSSTSVRLGQAFELGGTLTSLAAQKLLITVRLQFLKANGTHNAKVFALKDVELNAGEALEITKKIPFKAITTRVLYPGEHFAEFVVNGQLKATYSFTFVTN